MSDNKDDTKQEKNTAKEKLYNSLLGGQFSSVTLRSTIPSDTVGKGFKNTQTESPQHSVQSSVKTPAETPVEPPSQPPSQPPTQAPQKNTPAPKKTLQDIEQDIADANFDISDINAFGDHDTPEVNSIGDISTTAQAVLDKIQQKVDNTKSDTPPQQPRQDTFVAQNADKFAEALYAHNTGDSQNTSQPSTAHLDFDFDSIPPPQSPVQQSLMSSLLNLTIFLIVTVGLLGGGYYWYTSSIKSDNTAPVILQATLPIKVKPTTPTGMKIENLDKDVYGVLDDNNTLSDQVERLRPLPEQPIQLPKPKIDKKNAPSSDTKSLSAPLFENTKKTLASDGTVIEQLSIAPPPKKPVQKNPVIPTVKPQETDTTKTQAESMASVGQKNLIKPTQKPTQDTKNTATQKSIQSEAKKPTDSPPLENLVQKKSESVPNIQVVQPTKNTDTQKSVQAKKPTDSPIPENLVQKKSESVPNIQVVQPTKNTDTQKSVQAKKPTDSPPPENLVQKKSESAPNIQVVQPTKNIGWRVQLAALTNAPDAFKTHKVMLSKFKFLQDKPFHVELATVKGKKYYRLQIINFTDKQQAMALCSQIKNAGGDCILKK